MVEFLYKVNFYGDCGIIICEFFKGDLYLENLCEISVIKNILKKYGFNFSKSLGQNFIINSSICPRMAKSCSDVFDSGILEIGPGIGALTLELAKRFKKVVSVEIDRKLIPILSETTNNYGNIKIINKDILKINLKKLWEEEFLENKEVHVCANLPYYITSDIIMYILENNPGFSSITVMVQKEAAERICAMPGTRNSGAISLAVRFYGTPEILFNVGRNSFIPAPNVDSSVIKICMNNIISQQVKSKSSFFRVIKSAYAQRRKNILNSLSSGLKMPKDEIKTMLLNLGIDFNKRAEQLTLENFIYISNIL